MADTVEEVYVWSGTDWVPVVRDDCELPISSADGNVTLDSPSANTFTVSTGGSESFTIAANKDATFQGHVGVMSPAFSTGSLSLQGEVKPVNAGGAYGLWVSPTYVVDPDATYAKHARAFASVKAPANGQAFDTFTQFYASAVCGNTVGTNFGVYVSATGAINNVGCCVTGGGAVDAGNWGFYDNTGYKSHLKGGLQTPTVSGLAANDAQINLGSQAELKNGDGSEYAPVFPASIATKKYVDEAVDDVIWIVTQAEYDALGLYDNKRLYCITD